MPPTFLGLTTPPALLVVDDDAGMRHVVRRMLELVGAEVVEAANGERALSMVERDEANLLDVVVADLEMPVVSGVELLLVLRECRPGLGLAAMSGSTDLPASLDTVPFLRKPFSQAQLVHTVAPLLLQARAMRARSRQARADAAESRSMAARQHQAARELQERCGELMVSLVRLRAKMRESR